ncbi:MAG TPA: SUMF1/EgtB/PvdO family nonheme iron enzyme [Pyrinomonadaceae bacterium]|nr:SUMF1/EgtB/PvdO family nonheme iron enzyme [Pyrinomonadaceae bacterium]
MKRRTLSSRALVTAIVLMAVSTLLLINPARPLYSGKVIAQCPDPPCQKPTPAVTPTRKKTPSTRKSAPTPKKNTPATSLINRGVLKTVTLPMAPAAKQWLVRDDPLLKQMRATIRVTMDESGKVIAAEPTNGHPALANAAWSDAMQQHFTPATRNGRRAKSVGWIDYVFTDSPDKNTSTASPSANNSPANPSPAKPEPKPGTVVKNQIGMELVYVPSGSFMMGSTNGEVYEKPVHRVTISGDFYMGKYEVTQAQWQAVMGNNPSNFKGCGGNCPVEQVSWEDAQSFINKVNEGDDGFRYRLPTEAEWEYACRAGTTGDYAGNLSEMGWYSENSGDRTHGAGQKQGNAWGLADMHGNVWEWCQDWYHKTYGGAPSDGSAWLSGGEQQGRVLRGGAWYYDATASRSAFRIGAAPDARRNDLGFRVVAVR